MPEDRAEYNLFLGELDHMIEISEEFITDDEVNAYKDPEGRLQDLAALSHVRTLYINFFEEQLDD